MDRDAGYEVRADGSPITQAQSVHGAARDQLRAIVERIERLEEEKAGLANDIKDIFAEAKAMGYDVKALRTIIRMRKQDPDQRQEHEAVLATYMIALGMVPGAG